MHPMLNLMVLAQEGVFVFNAVRSFSYGSAELWVNLSTACVLPLLIMSVTYPDSLLPLQSGAATMSQ